MADHHVASRHILGMQPGVFALCAEGNPVVLGGVLAYQDFNSVRGNIAVRFAAGQLALLAAVGVLFHVAGAYQLLADLLQLTFADALVHVQQHALQVVRFLQGLVPLLRGDFHGRTGFLVFLEVFLGVLAGRQTDIQRHRQGSPVRIIPVGQFRLRHAFFQLIEIGVDCLSHPAVFIHPLRGRKLFQLDRQLPLTAFQLALQHPDHRGTLLVQSFPGVPRPEVDLQCFAQRFAGALLVCRSGQISKGENVLRLSVILHQYPGVRHGRQLFQERCQAFAGILQVCRLFLPGLQHAAGQFIRRRTAETGDALRQCAAQPGIRHCVQPDIQCFLCQRFRIQLVLCRRRQIGHSGLDLPHPAHFRVHMAGRFQNPVIFIQQ